MIDIASKSRFVCVCQARLLGQHALLPRAPFVYAGIGIVKPELFTNLEGANVGFQQWHPISVADKGNKLAGQAEIGGVWEWTSSPLAKHEGFEPMPLYPAYTGTSMTNIYFLCGTYELFSRFFRR